jgi:uncharacterized protein
MKNGAMEPHLSVWQEIMRIQIGSLSEGTHQYHFEADAADINLGEEFRKPVDVDATLDKTGKQLFLHVRVRTTGAFSCDRCTAPFELTLTPEYRMYFVTDETDAESLDPSEVQVVPPGLPIIDLADDVRQTVLLAVPLKLLCRRECRGLCPRCGKDLNIEPCSCPVEEGDGRWDQLRALRPGEN